MPSERIAMRQVRDVIRLKCADVADQRCRHTPPERHVPNGNPTLAIASNKKVVPRRPLLQPGKDNFTLNPKYLQR